MNAKKFKLATIVLVILSTLFLFSFTNNEQQTPQENFKFPYAKAGLTQKQAAAHLLNRFTFGVKTNDVEQVTKMGLENWFLAQLEGKFKETEITERLEDYESLNKTNTQILNTYPKGAKVVKMAQEAGAISKEDFGKQDKKELQKNLKAFREEKGLKTENELHQEFFNQKIIRATYGQNQLHEVLTDFWFNHFNISITKNDCAQFIPVYERDAIRPNVVGSFENLVLATAKSPAMLLYLDNFSSMGNNEDFEQMQKLKINKGGGKKMQGLNENYAREVMELHTLGVDGGYNQNDVTEAARVLTGWTIYPISDYGGLGQMKKIIERIGENKLTQKGFVHEGDFLFANNRHDSKPKKVLGVTYQNEGYNEGVKLLKYLANQKATAYFISKKLATRFVNDAPAKTLIEKMAKTFLSSNGDIKKVLTIMVSAPEFWSKEALREKTKSPLEYAISSVRTLDADIKAPMQINNWITKMGQKLYHYQAPTGYPDNAMYWINTGSLLNRMNFGLALAGKRIPGIAIDLAALNNNHEPESPEDALGKYAKILLPERDLQNTIKRLTPLVQDPSISNKINNAAEKNDTKKNEPTEDENMTMEETPKLKNKINRKLKNMEPATTAFGDNSMLAQVVGIIIGSPEFQRK